MKVEAGAQNRPNYALQLFMASALSLYVELLLIRYIAVEVHIFAYFKNLALMACFLGLGLGFAWTGKKFNLFPWSGTAFFGLVTLLSVALVLHWQALTFVDPFQFMLFGLGRVQDYTPTMAESLKTLAIMLLIFAAATFTFVGIGQYIGALFERLTPLKAYSLNVGGALFGSALYTLLCSLETPPGVWIVVAGVLFLLLRRAPSHFAIIAFGLVHMLFLAPFIARKYYGPDYIETVWSPYYRIDLVASRPALQDEKNRLWGYDLKVNYDTFQTILDCRKENLQKFPPVVQKAMLAAFALPYDGLKIKPREVLILASGNGSDVAAALRNGAEHVDAVDIDPVLTRLGKTLHPEKPYLDPRVHLYVMDARTYLQTCKNKYDLIVFAFLDSHTAFSSLSSLRTDNYVFTLESYKEAMKLLKDRGIIFVNFICFKDWLWNRQTNALAQASGMMPVAFYDFNGNVGVGSMAAGPGLKDLDARGIMLPGAPRTVDTASAIALATDDWPFLFLPSRELTLTYGLPLIIVLSFSALLVARELRAGISESSNWLMLILGMGFMLLEVRAMADLSLLFGSTWYVNSCVISAVLVMILIGNLTAARVHWLKPQLLLVLLVLSLFASTLIKPADLLPLGELSGRLSGALLYLMPASFAALLFATLFKGVDSPTRALAFNIVGGIIGISLEYLSMLFGVHFLGWLCILIYASALVPLMVSAPRKLALSEELSLSSD